MSLIRLWAKHSAWLGRGNKDSGYRSSHSRAQKITAMLCVPKPTRARLQKVVGSGNGVCRYRVGKTWAHGTWQEAERQLEGLTHCPGCCHQELDCSHTQAWALQPPLTRCLLLLLSSGQRPQVFLCRGGSIAHRWEWGGVHDTCPGSLCSAHFASPFHPL